MDVQFISDNAPYPDLFDELTDVQTSRQGGTIVHRGYHPKHGLSILVINALDSHAVLIADGATFL